jgi:hypothetical protein
MRRVSKMLLLLTDRTASPNVGEPEPSGGTKGSRHADTIVHFQLVDARGVKPKTTFVPVPKAVAPPRKTGVPTNHPSPK